MEDLTVGIDIGTSRAKGVLLNTQAEVLAKAEASYRPLYSDAGTVEQDPDDWWRAASKITRELVGWHGENAGNRMPAERVSAVAISGQGSTFVPVDSRGRPTRRAILWLDNRSESYSAHLRRTHGDLITSRNGKLPAHYTLEPKAMWLRNHEPERYRETAYFLSPTGYVVSRLTGEFVLNRSDGGLFLAYDLFKKTWSEELAALFGLGLEKYPRLEECASVIGEVTQDSAGRTGLKPGTKVLAGGEDVSSTGLAMGAVDVGDTFLSLGTSANIEVVIDQVRCDPRLLTFPHVIDGKMLIGGTVSSWGSSLDWLQEVLFPSIDSGKVREALETEVATSLPGAGGMVFLPYLVGELQPIHDAHVRGALIGIGRRTDRAALARAVMEGTALALKHVLSVIEELGVHPNVILAAGGPTRNRTWMQILADVVGTPVSLLLQGGDEAAVGDAILAASATNLIDLQAVASMRRKSGSVTVEPTEDLRAFYDSLFDVFVKIYPELRATFGVLTGMRRESVANPGEWPLGRDVQVTRGSPQDRESHSAG